VEGSSGNGENGNAKKTPSQSFGGDNVLPPGGTWGNSSTSSRGLDSQHTLKKVVIRVGQKERLKGTDLKGQKGKRGTARHPCVGDHVSRRTRGGGRDNFPRRESEHTNLRLWPAQCNFGGGTRVWGEKKKKKK